MNEWNHEGMNGWINASYFPYLLSPWIYFWFVFPLWLPLRYFSSLDRVYCTKHIFRLVKFGFWSSICNILTTFSSTAYLIEFGLVPSICVLGPGSFHDCFVFSSDIPQSQSQFVGKCRSKCIRSQIDRHQRFHLLLVHVGQERDLVIFRLYK